MSTMSHDNTNLWSHRRTLNWRRRPSEITLFILPEASTSATNLPTYLHRQSLHQASIFKKTRNSLSTFLRSPRLYSNQFQHLLPSSDIIAVGHSASNFFYLFQPLYPQRYALKNTISVFFWHQCDLKNVYKRSKSTHYSPSHSIFWQEHFFSITAPR